MNINRYNYEEYFLLYTDNELNPAQRLAVEQFVQKNPDLQEELLLFTRATLKPDDGIIFGNKESLMYPGNKENFIHAKNYEELFILYADDELNSQERASVERFVDENPQYQESFKLMQAIKLVADPALTYPGKESLYRHETSTKPVIFAWWRIAAAAAVLLFTGIIWLNDPSSKTSRSVVKVDNGQLKKAIKTGDDVPGKTRNNLTTPGPAISVDTTVSSLSTMAQATTIKARKKQEIPVPDMHHAVKVIAQTKTRNSRPRVAETRIAEQTKKPIKPANTKTVEIIESEPMNRALTYNKINESEGNNKPVIGVAETKTDVINKDVYQSKVVLASSVSNENENVILANIPVDRKNSLRGLFRKASRFIDKTTSIKPAKKSGFAIGNIEIAFQ